MKPQISPLYKNLWHRQSISVYSKHNKNKMTAVEWLKKELEEYGDPGYCKIEWEMLDELIEQAKKMEKEQEERAYKRGQKHKKPLKDSNPINKYLKSE